MTADAQYSQVITLGTGRAERRVQQPAEQKPWILDFSGIVPAGATGLTVTGTTQPVGVSQFATPTVSGFQVTLYVNTANATSNSDYEISVTVNVTNIGATIGVLSGGFVLSCRSLLPTLSPSQQTNPYDSGSLLYRVWNALYAPGAKGWINLGTIANGDLFHEADVAYNSTDGKYYVFNTDPPDPAVNRGIVYRSATTLAGIVTATKVQAVDPSFNLAYPSIVWDGTTWWLLGTDGPGSSAVYTATGSPPGPFTALSGGTTIAFGDNPAGHVDAQWRRVSIGGTFYWIMVSISQFGAAPRQYLRIFKHADPFTFTTRNTWQVLIPGNATSLYDIYLYSGLPAWSSASNPDPNYMTWNSRHFVAHQGVDAAGFRSQGITEVSIQGNPPTLAAAIGTPLVVATQSTPAFENGSVMSDLAFLSCPDGIDRIFGFWGVGWACLELA